MMLSLTFFIILNFLQIRVLLSDDSVKKTIDDILHDYLGYKNWNLSERSYTMEISNNTSLMDYYKSLPGYANEEQQVRRINNNQELIFIYNPYKKLLNSLRTVYEFIDNIVQVLEKPTPHYSVVIFINNYFERNFNNEMELIKFLISRYILCCYNVRIFYSLELSSKHYVALYNLLKTSTASAISDHIDIKNRREDSLTNFCSKYIFTRKYVDACMPRPDRDGLLPLLITGLGGSGTHYVANTLRGLGIDVTHEQIAKFGSVSWQYSVGDHFVKLPYPGGAAIPGAVQSAWVPRFETVIHLVRCPMKQISSMTSHTEISFEFIKGYAKNVLDMSYRVPAYTSDWIKFVQTHQDVIKKSLKFNCDIDASPSVCNLPLASVTWVFWNKMVKEYAETTYHVKDIDSIITHVCLLKPIYNEILIAKSECQRYLSLSSWKERQMILHEISSYSKLIEQKQVTNTTIGLHSRRLKKLTEKEKWEHGYRFSTGSHKMHLKHSLDDVRKIDADVADAIEVLGKELGFKNVESC